MAGWTAHKEPEQAAPGARRESFTGDIVIVPPGQLGNTHARVAGLQVTSAVTTIQPGIGAAVHLLEAVSSSSLFHRLAVNVCAWRPNTGERDTQPRWRPVLSLQCGAETDTIIINACHNLLPPQ